MTIKTIPVSVIQKAASDREAQIQIRVSDLKRRLHQERTAALQGRS